MNRSLVSKNVSMQDDIGNVNILDELNMEANLVNTKRETLLEAISRLSDKLSTESIA